MKDRPKSRPSLDELIKGIDQQDRIMLSRAITLVESKLQRDKELANQLLDHCINNAEKSIRIGVTGVPGVGKSSFIEAFGLYLTSLGKKVAVLSIDPTSTLSKGSILGDKTRMANLSNDPLAYIRPSPSGTSLGGVAGKTRESILLCEAAGFEVILVETVGVGQSETAVKGMVDFFLLLMLAGGGDELQGIKRGIMEMADLLVINKADGENISAAKRAKKAYENAIHLFPAPASGWVIPVALCSSITGVGVEQLWGIIERYQTRMTANGFLQQNRKDQNINWFNQMINERLESRFYQDPDVQDKLSLLTRQITNDELSVRHAIDQLFSG